MEMVFHAIDPIEMTFFIGEELVDVGKKSASLVFDERGFSMLGRKNDVVNKLSVSAHKNLELVEK
ncbi:MAG: hypothetical protein ACI8YP_000652 [Algoriphagus sp.]|jgi:hypothetical protein